MESVRSSSPSEQGSHARILCVDDDPVVLTLTQATLTKQGYEVVAASSGEQALTLVSGAAPDLILLDVQMGGMDGYETCAELRRRPALADVPVIFATGREGEEDRARAVALGAVDYLVKPVARTTLLAKVGAHLAASERWRALRAPMPARESMPKVGNFSRFKQALGELYKLDAEKMATLTAAKPKELYAVAAAVGLDETQVAEYIAAFLHLPIVPTLDPARLALGVLPTSFCKSNMVVVIETEGGSEKHAFVLSNPFDWEPVQHLQQWLGRDKRLNLNVTEPGNIHTLFEGHAELTKRAALPSASAKLAEHLATAHAPELDSEKFVSVTEDSPPIVRLATELIETAHALGASDIHIEPAENEVVVRYRVDGVLRVVNRFPRTLIRPLVSRIKIMASLDIVERRLPQDGRIPFRRFSSKEMEVDLRVATAPMQYGEKVVMRLLDKRKAVLPLRDLGFSDYNLERYRARIAAPDGMILHVGPTGSGKSMTLYAALNEIKRPDINVQTAEDPIEYTLPGINQLQVHPEIGLSFARALRSYLRQDPDVLLVGEIRDRETADVAVEAALTGHLLLSTLHTNDAASTVVRLTEMGIEPFLVSSSLLVVCAQRLLRRLCTDCRTPYSPTDEERRMVGTPDDKSLVLYRPLGCSSCNDIGYRGRIGIHELLIPDDRMRKAISQGITAEALKHLAVTECGTVTLYWDAMAKVRQGICALNDAIADIRADEFDSRPANLPVTPA